MIIINNIKLDIDQPKEQAIITAKKTLGIQDDEIQSIFVHKMSVDARKRVQFVYSVAVQLLNTDKEQLFLDKSKDITIKPKTNVDFCNGEEKMLQNPVICGFGPAGIFAALVLARQGFRPIVIEQGEDIDTRTKTVKEFETAAKLNTRSNIQFGEGGAGTFSDGKLTTRIGDMRCDFVTDTLVQFGAPSEIKMLAKPHIGTDLLVSVIKNIREEIISLGGKILFNTKLVDIKTKNSKVCSAMTDKGEIATNTLVIAIGHSARDTLFMLDKQGLEITAKAFSVGVRVESLQSEIDKGLYHDLAGHHLLPKGEYQLKETFENRGVYTFCMCPGGNVVAAASEENTVSVNGMSYHARDGKNANSALVVSVTEQDFDNDFKKAVEFQRKLEQKAFAMGENSYKAPAQTVDMFLKGKKGLNLKTVQPTYPIGVVESDLSEIFPQHITNGLRYSLQRMNRKLSGFANSDNILTGVETRTSSPARIIREQETLQSNISGIYPCGEGAGYAGGIMSAAVDGVRVAQQICSIYKEI